MNRLTRLVLKRPVTTLLAVLALVVFGFSSLTTLRLELMPDMEMPMKIVYTVYPGADSESVDDLVTTPIEDKVGSLSGVKSITSSSYDHRDEYGFYAKHYLFCQYLRWNRCTGICQSGCSSGIGSTEQRGTGHCVRWTGTVHKSRA